MKSRKSSISARYHKTPTIEFEYESSMTSFAGLIIYFSHLMELKSDIRNCFRHEKVVPQYGFWRIFLFLVLILLTGFRKLSDSDYLSDDPLVKRILGLKQLPSVSTLSRGLNRVGQMSIDNLRRFCRCYVLNGALGLSRITLDFDGSVFSTTRHAQGTAIGFNKKKKGARSYYPLFCTVAQTAQFLDLHHRPGNVHDSNGSNEFISDLLDEVRSKLGKGVTIETRFDSAFFGEERIKLLLRRKVDFSVSVPFFRMPILKSLVENRKRWHKLDDEWSYFEFEFAPKSWEEVGKQRIIVTRQRVKKPHKGPLQLDLFYPVSHDYDYSAIMTNKTVSAGSVIKFHHGRGLQEDLIGQAKDEAQMDYIPVKGLYGNQLYCLAAMFAHNITKRIQMDASEPRHKKVNSTRSALWRFSDLKTIRNTIVRRAGRIIKPQGRLTLVVSATKSVESNIQKFLSAA